MSGAEQQKFIKQNGGLNLMLTTAYMEGYAEGFRDGERSGAAKALVYVSKLFEDQQKRHE
ncbi:hypothetical protein [Paenibacillus sp. YAF4_2]|uniref:hypothetical protein n=1 Tax=Paenibacillus sp. YAF4_2 TaxID=3233085 RepID=UPI003F97EBE7